MQKHYRFAKDYGRIACSGGPFSFLKSMVPDRLNFLRKGEE